jgi:hypothetical protein
LVRHSAQFDSFMTANRVPVTALRFEALEAEGQMAAPTHMNPTVHPATYVTELIECEWKKGVSRRVPSRIESPAEACCSNHDCTF